jgi:hypothetical protein
MESLTYLASAIQYPVRAYDEITLVIIVPKRAEIKMIRR